MKKKILIIVDVQNDFVSGALGTKEAENMLLDLINKAQNFTGEILMTKDTHFDDYMNTQEGKNLPVPHCIKGTKGWDFPDELDEVVKNKQIKVYEKQAFGSVQLAEDLKRQYEADELESVELVGICTDICVVSNALLLKANMPELPVFVDADCCAGVTPEKHKEALSVMESCQITVYHGSDITA